MILAEEGNTFSREHQSPASCKLQAPSTFTSARNHTRCRFRGFLNDRSYNEPTGALVVTEKERRRGGRKLINLKERFDA